MIIYSGNTHLRENLPLVLKRGHQSSSSDPLLLQLLANLGPVFIVWVADLAEFNTGVFEEESIPMHSGAL